MFSNFLAASVEIFNGFGDKVFTLNWIGEIIKALIEGCSSIGVGIILFTLILKAITLPFDIYSRISMKKNSLKMKKMEPELKKLQRQYANNKELYNQKVQAIYKKQGYSMLSSCLPSIITIVIFIVVIGEFSNYSNYSNLNMINGISKAYNDKVAEFVDDTLVEEIVEGDEKTSRTFYVNEQKFFENEQFADYSKEVKDAVEMSGAKENSAYEAIFSIKDMTKFGDLVKSLNENGFTGVLVAEKGSEAVGNSHIIYTVTEGAVTYEVNTEFYKGTNEELCGKVIDYYCNKYVKEVVKPAAAKEAALTYEKNRPQFLWVKNLWVPDLPWKHPVQSKLEDYEFYKKLDTNQKDLKQEYFLDITADLTKEKSEPNGYLVLVVLSIGVMLLSQFIMQKMQKPQLELQSVDGQAASTSKMMMWMMPIMFGVFAFIYTASFSLYMIVSSVISTLSTVIINKIVEVSFAKKLALEEAENDKRIRK